MPKYRDIVTKTPKLIVAVGSYSHHQMKEKAVEYGLNSFSRAEYNQSGFLEWWSFYTFSVYLLIYIDIIYPIDGIQSNKLYHIRYVYTFYR